MTRILVVDDEPLNRKVLCGHLKIFGYEGVPVNSGEKALEALGVLDAPDAPDTSAAPDAPKSTDAPDAPDTPDTSFDLVLADVMMPGMDGFDLVKKIREHSALQDLPVVIVTALRDSDARLNAVKAGANDFIGKPIDALELRVRLESLLRMKEAQDALRSRQAELEEVIRAQAGSSGGSETELRDLFDNGPDMLLALDVNTGLVLECNATLAQRLGVSREQITAGSLSGLCHPKDASDVHQVLDDLVATGELQDEVLTLQAAGGARVVVALRANAARDEEGNILYSRISLREVTGATG
jgi:PAS domain S-box-containing protein